MFFEGLLDLAGGLEVQLFSQFGRNIESIWNHVFSVLFFSWTAAVGFRGQLIYGFGFGLFEFDR